MRVFVHREVSLKKQFLFLLSFLAVGFANIAHSVEKKSEKQAKLETATFAAGCYWGVEEFFRKTPGVMSSRVGFTGGTTPNPKYDETHDGHTGHAESVEIQFDPKKVKYEFLLDQFFKMHDPTTKDRQGNDTGNQCPISSCGATQFLQSEPPERQRRVVYLSTS